MNKATDEIHIIVSPEKYTDNDMPLASISPSGVITDRRIFACSKISMPTKNIIQERAVTVKKGEPLTITPPFSGYSYICMLNTTRSETGSPVFLSETPQMIGGDSLNYVKAHRIGNDLILEATLNSNYYNELYVQYLLF